MEERFETFTVLINRINRNIRRIKNAGMAEYGLRAAHISCLYHLHMADGLTATDLCERCEEDKATVSRAVEHLENEGYLICECRGAKRYKTPIRLTATGRKIGQQIADKVDRVLETVSTALTEEERIALYRSLTRISDSLDHID